MFGLRKRVAKLEEENVILREQVNTLLNLNTFIVNDCKSTLSSYNIRISDLNQRLNSLKTTVSSLIPSNSDSVRSVTYYEEHIQRPKF